MTGIVVLRTFANEADARFAAAVLDANGVPARVVADTAGGALPSMALFSPFRLLVHAEDATLALEILDTDVGDEEEGGDEADEEGDESSRF